MADMTVYTARKVVTMDPGQPEAEAVAVKDGRIVSVGTLETMQPWFEHFSHEIDDSFASKTIFPGFIDPHTHLGMSGAFLALNYVGPIKSPGPNGMNPALCSRGEVLDRLSQLSEGMSDPDQPLLAWGFDPAIQGGHLHRDELDSVSTRRPLWVLAYAPHFIYTNSPMLDRLQVTDQTNTHGVGKDASGRLNGQFVEVEAMHIALGPFRDEIMRPETSRQGLRMLGEMAKRAGVTTTADLAFGFTNFDRELNTHQTVVPDPAFPLRMAVVPLESAMQRAHGAKAVEFVKRLAANNDDKLFFHGIKFMGDGSYPAMSLRLRFPGYLDGTNGLRGDIPWDELADRMLPYWKAGIQIHAHANGDETIDVMLDALARLQEMHPRFDHRFTIEHYCISTPYQARRLKALGGLASVNNYFVHYRGQIHDRQGYGPDRAATTARLGSLERENVVFALHSDFSLVVAPMHPLTAVWIAVTRIAADGKTLLAPGERIGLDRALRAITIDAAHLLRLDHKLGSLEPGKLADFTVLDENPYDVDLATLRDIPIWGTVLGGVPQPA